MQLDLVYNDDKYKITAPTQRNSKPLSISPLPSHHTTEIPFFFSCSNISSPRYLTQYGTEVNRTSFRLLLICATLVGRRIRAHLAATISKYPTTIRNVQTETRHGLLIQTSQTAKAEEAPDHKTRGILISPAVKGVAEYRKQIQHFHMKCLQ